MKGRRTWRGLIANWVRIELPKVSAVMPVPSETKKTVRLGMVQAAPVRVAMDPMIGNSPVESMPTFPLHAR